MEVSNGGRGMSNLISQTSFAIEFLYEILINLFPSEHFNTV